MQQTVAALVEINAGPAQAAHDRYQDAALQERLGTLESRVIQQERTLRHTLTMLIEWIERGDGHSVAA